ncbi:hypothetical protein [Nostoc sp. FACHB-888]|uniref:hypothetical protein n=1 Tax=Nostoc sp. FACHB-888 TaxID=2692842 RepID=UPI001685DE0A|nr:hypothetical protein [Nostoc sp. FACHB-888]MBD2245410.1 hypothetical protein [Nostoc sp. FACHB-888]
MFIKSSIFLIINLIVVIVCALLGLLELSLGLLAFIPLFLIIYISFLDKSVELRLLSIAHMTGQFSCWVIGFLGCFYILPSTGYQIGKHTITTMILINLVMWASLIGSLMALKVRGLPKMQILFSPLSTQLTSNGVVITGIVFVLSSLSNFIFGYYDARYAGNVSSDSPLYFLGAISSLQYLFFFLLGTRLQVPLISHKNFFPLFSISFTVILSSMAGGREPVIRSILFFFIGSIYGGKIKFAILRNIFLFLVPFLLAFIIILGYARAEQRFYNGDFSDRLATISQVMLGKIEFQGNEYDDPVFGLLTRITEPTGQLVIDAVTDRQKYIGLQNFERITSIFIPKFITGEKLPLDDGSERLRDNYGVNITEFTSAPITFMADSFERGGYLMVFFASLILSFWLTCVGSFLSLIKQPLLKPALLCSFSFVSLRLYTPSILGVISTVSYSFLRDFILISLLISIIKFSVKVSFKGQTK